MTLWFVLTIMTSVAAVLVSAPFIRRFNRPQAGSAGDIEVYRDQLKEIASELRGWRRSPPHVPGPPGRCRDCGQHRGSPTSRE